MVQVQRTVVGAAAALVLVIGSVTVAPVRVTNGPNCLAAPCPPPDNRSGAGAEGAIRSGDAQDVTVRSAGGPICLTGQCPPPPDNHTVVDVKEALLGGDVRSSLVASGPICLAAPCPPPPTA